MLRENNILVKDSSNNPFKENYGTLLIKFLNVNFSSFETAYNIFFYFMSPQY